MWLNYVGRNGIRNISFIEVDMYKENNLVKWGWFIIGVFFENFEFILIYIGISIRCFYFECLF